MTMRPNSTTSRMTELPIKSTSHSTKKLILSLTLTGLAGAMLAGCTTTLLPNSKIDYKSASERKSGPTLDVPPDLSQISRDNRYSVPENGTTGALTASSYNAKNAGAAVKTQTAATNNTAINNLQGMQIERAGSERWLVVPQSAEFLWPKIKDFWQENGFLINEESQTTGVMETDWAENRAKIPQDFLRKTIGYVFDSLYSTGERDKFRTRLERRADGSTEIYISHRGVEEVLTGSQKESSTWTARPNDPRLEVAFLTRLMMSLGATEEKAQQIASATVEAPAKAKLIKSADKSSIEVSEPFDRAWRRVGLALDRVNFTVEDRDRAQGIYFVRYVDQDDQNNKGGFFSRLFSSDKEKASKRYRITVKAEGNLTRIAVQNNDGGAENSAATDKILTLVLEPLK